MGKNEKIINGVLIQEELSELTEYQKKSSNEGLILIKGNVFCFLKSQFLPPFDTSSGWISYYFF